MLSAGISCDVTVVSSPPLSVSSFSWESSSGWPKKQARMAFDMHSSHNLIASFSKESHELRLDVWPQLRLFRACVSVQLLIKELKSYMLRLITTVPSKSKHFSYRTPSSCPSPPKQEALAVSHSAERGHSLWKKKLLPKELPEEAMVVGYLMTARLSLLSGI